MALLPRWRLRNDRYSPFADCVRPSSSTDDALLAREADGRRRRLAVGAERRGDRRAGDQLFEVLLTLGDLGEPRRQPPRRAVRLDRRAGRDARVLQPRLDALAELPRQPRQPGGGQFFDADFYEELSIHSGITSTVSLSAAT